MGTNEPVFIFEALFENHLCVKSLLIKDYHFLFNASG